jgi:hypothetical protein
VGRARLAELALAWAASLSPSFLQGADGTITVAMPDAPMLSAVTGEDRFVISRRRRLTVTPFLGRVDVYDFTLAATDDPICRVRQRVWRFNQDIRFFRAGRGKVDVMRLRAQRRFDPWARYELIDAGGETIGAIQKVFARGSRRAAYLLYDHDGHEVARVDGRAPAAPIRRHARRVAVAGLTGLAGLVGLAFLGPPGLAGVISLVAVTGARELRERLDPVDAVSVFDITRDGELLGTQRRRPPELGDMMSRTLLGPGWATTVFDVDMGSDRARTVDRRLVLALPVALDALRGLVADSALR